MPEGGWLMVKGMAAQVTFYKSLFDKLGVKADWMQVGKYKSYGEPFTRTSMSPAFREEVTELLHDTHALLVEAIAERKGISAEAATALVDNGPYTPHEALKSGLISRVGYENDMVDAVKSDLKEKTVKLDPKYGKPKVDNDFSGFAGFMKMMQALSGESAKKPESNLPKIALIYASGAINVGKSSGETVFGEASMGSETVIKHLREARGRQDGQGDRPPGRLPRRLGPGQRPDLARGDADREADRRQHGRRRRLGRLLHQHGRRQGLCRARHDHRLDRRHRRQVRPRRPDGQARRDDRHDRRRQERHDPVLRHALLRRPRRPRCSA